MKTIFESILSKAPWLVRWVFYFFWALIAVAVWLFSQGWSAKTRSDKYFSAVASDVFVVKIAPIQAVHDAQIINIESRLDSMDSKMEANSRVLYRMEGKLDQALSK